MTIDPTRPKAERDISLDFVSMAERIAWAVERARDHNGDNLEAIVREILCEMRRPSDQMIAAGNAKDGVAARASAILHWQAMIEEALR